jgi:hypothetical protein
MVKIYGTGSLLLHGCISATRNGYAPVRSTLAETHEVAIAIIQLMIRMSNSRKKRILFQKLPIRFTFDLDLNE